MELIALFCPLLFILAWLRFAQRSNSLYVTLSGLLLAGLPAFSQNFSFIYRDIHQLIQILLFLVLLIHVLKFRMISRLNYLLVPVITAIFFSLVFGVFDADFFVQALNIFSIAISLNFFALSIRDDYDLDALLRFYSKLAIIASLVGIFEFLLFGSARIEATMANPNYFSYFLGIGFSIVIDKFTGKRRWLYALLILLAMLLSGSRAALAFPLFHYLTYLFHSNASLKRKVLSFSLALSLFAGLNYSSLNLISDRSFDGSDAERQLLTQVALRMANDHPLTGVGWGRFPAEFSNYTTHYDKIVLSNGSRIDISFHDRRVTHNDFLRIATELGWPAAVFSVLASIYVLSKAYGMASDYNTYIFACLAASLFFSLTHNNLNSILFWLLLFLPFFIASRWPRGASSKNDKVAAV